MKTRVVIIGGPSGSGKTVMEKLLCEMYPDMFNKLYQVTTRDMRTGESQMNPYMFIDEEKYHNIEHDLVGKTEVNGRYYGTMFTPVEGKFNTIILNRKGIEDFMEKYPDFSEIEYIVVMVDSRNLVSREGRDMSFVENERWDMMEVMNMCIVHNPPDYKSAEFTKEKIIKLFNQLFE